MLLDNWINISSNIDWIVEGLRVGMDADDYSMLLVRMLLDNWINISNNTEWRVDGWRVSNWEPYDRTSDEYLAVLYVRVGMSSKDIQATNKF